MNFFTFNGEKSYDYGLVISGEATFDSPRRDVEKLSIPGRNGDLVIDNGRFENKILKYPAFLLSGFKANSKRLKEWLLESTAYKILSDTYDNETYRLAYYSGNIEFQMQQLNIAGETELTFDCKPQKFFYSGDQFYSINRQGTTLFNPSRFPSYPIIKITGTGSGTVTVGNHIITINGNTQAGLIIDCDIQDAYYNATNCNQYVTRNSFPCSLDKGTNTISWTGNYTKVEVKPRWWTV